MARRAPRPLTTAVELAFPGIADPVAAISGGAVSVDGIVNVNPRSRVAADAVIRLVADTPLRGEAKLRAALDIFTVDVTGRVALDVGAAAGGFTRVLIAAGAARVYACDAGHGQLLGSLRQDPRVVNLEATNVAELSRALVPETIDVVSIDVSYLALGAAVEQLGGLTIAPGADLLGLVKPMFELQRAEAPSEPADIAAAAERAAERIAAAGWDVRGAVDSPVTGSRGAREMLLHAVRL